MGPLLSLFRCLERFFGWPIRFLSFLQFPLLLCFRRYFEDLTCYRECYDSRHTCMYGTGTVVATCT